MSSEPVSGRAAESKVALVKGTADVLPSEFARLDTLERGLLDHFALAGYRRVRVPTLEDRALHERKSGARIVASLYQVSGGWNEPVCLRPEVTTGIVRAYNDAPDPLPLPWRVSYAGPVFRRLPTGPGVLREFHQVGVERLDEPGSGGDAEAIWLADWSLAEAGIPDATIRVGHAGLIQELLKRSGLPLGVQVALVEVLGEAAGAGDAATEDRVLNAAEAHLNSLAEWLATAHNDETAVPAEDAGVDRLFRTLYPQVVGRRSGRDIIGRIRRKWDLGHGLAGVLDQVRSRVRELADLRGPALDVLDRLWRYSDLVPALTNELTDLVADLRAYGVDPTRVELDLGFGRGIGFYSQMMFVLLADTPGGPLEVCGGGRYDGLARALGSPHDVGGVGFAFGLERLQEALDTLGKGQANPARSPILLVARGPDAYGLAAWLRSKGCEVVLTEGSGRKVDTSGFARVIHAGGPDLLVNDSTGATTRLATREDLLRLLNGGRS
jgi:histidyl-tRNA synthetase